MKRTFFSFLMFLSFAVTAQEQWLYSDQQKIDSLRQSVFNYKVPFFVPDNPSFKALDIDPSNVLRPTDIKSFAFMLSPYVDTKGFGLPKNFAMEFSPGRTASKQWTVAQYNSSAWKRFAYNFAFTAATRFDENETTDPFKLSLGFHYQFIPRGSDPVRNDSLYIKTQKAIVNKAPLVNAYVRLHKLGPDGRAAIYAPSNDSALYKRFIVWVKSDSIPDSLSYAVKAYESLTFASRLKRYEADHWNDPKFTFAMAWIGQAQDSTLDGIGYNAVNVWATWACRPTKRSKRSQILLGGSYRQSINPDSLGAVSMLTLNGRFYYGNETVRGFSEGQFKYATFGKSSDPSAMPSLLINFGLEAKFGPKFGIFASAGIENFFDEKDPWSKLRSSLNLRYFLE